MEKKIIKKQARDVNKQEDEVSAFIIISIFFSGMFLYLFYLLTKTGLFSLLCLPVVFVFMIWGMVLNARENLTRTSVLLYKSASTIFSSISCIGISLSYYYLYLKRTSILFVVIILVIYIMVALSTFVYKKNKFSERPSKQSKKMASLYTTLSVLGYSLVSIFAYKLSQNSSAIILISIMGFLGYLLEYLGITFGCSYKMSKKV